MSLITSFLSAAKDIVSLGPKLNSSERARIREVVLKLGQELDRGTKLMSLYLQGVSNVNDMGHLQDFLQNSYSRMLDLCNECLVCKGLYDLMDEFQQAFHPVSYSTAIGNSKSIEELLGYLCFRERAIVDEISDSITNLVNMGYSAKSTDDGQLNEIKKKVIGIANNLQDENEKVKKTVRQIVDNL